MLQQCPDLMQKIENRYKVFFRASSSKTGNMLTGKLQAFEAFLRLISRRYQKEKPKFWEIPRMLDLWWLEPTTLMFEEH